MFGEDGLGACLGEVALGGTPQAAGTQECQVSYMPMPIAEYARSIGGIFRGHWKGCACTRWCNLVQQQAALGESFGHELEVEVVEVSRRPP